MNIGSTRIQEIESLRESMDRALWIWAGFHYRDEEAVDMFHRRTGCEILAVDTSLSVETLLNYIKKHNKTLQLFRRGLLEVFTRISGWEKWDLSVNAYIGDVGNDVFIDVMEEVMTRFKRKDRTAIVIEIVETPYGSIDGRFIDNIIWLRKQWFRIAVDDFDLFGDEHDNVSVEILEAVWQYCSKIKLDWRVTKKLIEQKFVRRQLLDLRSNHLGKKIVAEWIRTRADVLALIGIVDSFQISSHIPTSSVK